jgi:Site-specific recombinases, DNA invertase Pin homologs
MKCVAYIRVSTKEQDEEIQRGAIEDFAKAKNIEILSWYVDKGVSGANIFSQRPEASRLLQDLDKLRPECVVSWSIDRLGRTMLDTLNTVIKLEEKNIRVITIKEEFLQTLDQNIRRLILSILSWVAEFERRRMRERQEEAWRQGKQKGRPQKVSDTTILKYYKIYVAERGVSIKDMWKIMKGDGIDISYHRLLERLKELKRQGKIIQKTEIKS